MLFFCPNSTIVNIGGTHQGGQLLSIIGLLDSMLSSRCLLSVSHRGLTLFG